MGTHPIFESDFDCLTECTRNGNDQNVDLKQSNVSLQDIAMRNNRIDVRQLWLSQHVFLPVLQLGCFSSCFLNQILV